MKKVFGIILIIVGLICLPKVFTPSVPGTIGGLIGISLVSFLPAYFLLRNKKEGNTRLACDKQQLSVTSSKFKQTLGNPKESQSLGKSQRQETSQVDVEYDNLFEELKTKCHPKQFMEPYDHEKVKVANELYASILEASDNKEKQVVLRQEAIEKLGVVFSSRRIYDKLIALTNPANFMDPYDAEKVAIANDYYQKVQQNSENILELEKIWKSIHENTLFISQTLINGEIDSNNRDVDNIGLLIHVFIFFFYS